MVVINGLFEFPVDVIGCLASRLCSDPVDGEVIALFDSTFYLAAGEYTLCVGPKDMNLGPLNVVTTAPLGMNWPASGLRRYAKVVASATEIRIGDRFVFPVAQSSIWSPAPPSASNDPNCARLGLDALRRFWMQSVPSDGLGRFLASGFIPLSDDRICAAAQSSIKEARLWLSAAFANRDWQPLPDPTWAAKLMGLGPGLTPSGDDFIGGIMITLHALGETDMSHVLWRQVHDQARAAGNAISLAHMAAAAQGAGGEGIHIVLSAILRGDAEEIQASTVRIDKIGRTSGWDTMAGVVTTLECWQVQKMMDGAGIEPVVYGR